MSQGFPFLGALIFGHRRDSAPVPENTLAAFCQAMEHGAAGIDLDAQLTPVFPGRRQGRGMLAWRVAMGEEALRAVSLGAVGVIANDPGMARNLLGEE